MSAGWTLASAFIEWVQEHTLATFGCRTPHDCPDIGTQEAAVAYNLWLVAASMCVSGFATVLFKPCARHIELGDSKWADWCENTFEALWKLVFRAVRAIRRRNSARNSAAESDRLRTSQVGTLNAVAWTYFFSETLAVHTQWVSEDAYFARGSSDWFTPQTQTPSSPRLPRHRYFARGVLLGGWSLLLTILFSLALSALTRAKVRLVTECKAGGMTDAEVEHEAEGVNESAEDHVHAREEKKKAAGSYVGRATKGIQGIATFQKSSWKPFYLAVIGLVDSSSGW